MRRLNLLTESIPFTPKFQPNFQSNRGSVVRRMRIARAGNMRALIVSPLNNDYADFFHKVDPSDFHYAQETLCSADW